MKLVELGPGVIGGNGLDRGDVGEVAEIALVRRFASVVTTDAGVHTRAGPTDLVEVPGVGVTAGTAGAGLEDLRVAYADGPGFEHTGR